jgi:5-methylcytosine-specific restriction protein A
VASEDWTDAELRAGLSAYLEMLQLELLGKPYVKTQYRREALAGPLSRRSNGSFEFRMANFSAFFEAKGMPYVQGYKPRGNIGSQVKDTLERIFHELASEELVAFEPTSDEVEVRRRARSIAALNQEQAPSGNVSPETVEASTVRFKRSPAVVAYVLNQSEGMCESCEDVAPFKDATGKPFLEVHHLKPLAAGGPDTTDNAIACCPNCHREMHFGENGPTLTAETIKRVNRLKEY